MGVGVERGGEGVRGLERGGGRQRERERERGTNFLMVKCLSKFTHRPKDFDDFFKAVYLIL